MTGRGVRVSVLAVIPSLPVSSSFLLFLLLTFHQASALSHRPFSGHSPAAAGPFSILVLPSVLLSVGNASHGDAECFCFTGLLRYPPSYLGNDLTIKFMGMYE